MSNNSSKILRKSRLSFNLSPILSAPPGLDISNKLLRQIPFSAKIKITREKMKFNSGPLPSYIQHFDTTKTVFVRIPKNASNSLISLFYNGDKTLPHYSAEYFRNTIPDRFRDYLVYAPIRNPIQRFKSAFLYYKFKSQIPQERELMDNEMNFINSVGDFVSWLNDFDDISDAKIMTWHHFRTQKDYICDMSGKIIVDVVFPIEDMVQGIELISSQTGITGKLPKENVNGTKVPSEEVSQKILDYYAEDITLWNEVKKEKLICFTGENATLIE